MRSARIPFATGALVVVALTLTAPSATAQTPPELVTGASTFDSTLFGGLHWRSIGPYRGGRVTTVTGIPQQPKTFYMGATGGGIWKTTDAGITWNNVSDNQIRMGSIGALAVAPSDPNVVYAGMGESEPRGQSSSWGDGMYRSTDAGKTWTDIGMRSSLLPALAPALWICAAPLAAQQLPGYTPAASVRERALEADAVTRPDTGEARAESVALSSEIHVAGTPAQAMTRDTVLGRMKAWGLSTSYRTYKVYLPHATAVHVWRVSPDPEELSLAEPPVPGDRVSAEPQYPTVNGSSAAGDVTAPVVYVNYGLIGDYAKLDSLGVSVKGKIVIARYGRSFRGIKAREAEKHGAAALLIYSDPADDGYDQGDVYPEGPMRPKFGVQRGSVLNVDGDPTTPGYPSKEDAPRVSPDSVIPHIPVVPISYGNAQELLEGVRGTDIPDYWQGGLPFRYHVGPGPVVARVAVKTDEETAPYKHIWDTFGVVRGSEFPDEIVVVGGHRDAWGPGTDDNVSGSVSVMEIAHAVADELKAGKRPKRTMVFATWDAEEWGLVGSVEYVEDDSLRLEKGGVAYLNQDMIASGPTFGGGGSPSLRAVLRSAAEEVPAPDTPDTPNEGSLWDAWMAQSHTPEGQKPRMGDPGGGSDYAGFYNHLGIPILEWGFGGAQGIYHSQYDDPAWMSRFGDPGYREHIAAAQLGAAIALRIANADVLPYDYVEYAKTMRGYLPALGKSLSEHGWTLDTSALSAAIDRMEARAKSFAATRDAALAGKEPSGSTLEKTNAALLRVERALTRPHGLVGRSWFRNLVYVADEDNGYATMVFPSVKEAIRAGDEARTGREIADLASRFDHATAALKQAEDALR
ncbi:MAG: M20/M25/M40 family metallo-hydrolase [Gemmatimonadetes bacterium]|nr:M20/M25/M40 family metallo-hydrolase [Gemmatimonadota bacterium]